MFNEKRRKAYLVRWQEDENPDHWRSTVENAYTGEEHHFSDRNELIQFLLASLSDGNVIGDEDGMSLENRPDLTDVTQEHFRS